MGRGERRVKRLDAERRGVLREARGTHQRQRPEAANVAIVEVTAVVQREAHGGVRSLVLGERTATEEQRTGESGLYDDAILRVEIEHDELRAAPRAHEGAIRGAHVE